MKHRAFRSRLHILPAYLALALAVSPALAEDAPRPAVVPPPASKTAVADAALAKAGRDAVQRGLAWLAARQKPDGSWSDTNFPALTAFPLWAFSLGEHPGKASIVSNAVSLVMGAVQPDGGIYRKLPRAGGGLANYNTAICMTALHVTGDPALAPVVRKARQFVAASQLLEGDDVYRGGFGYDKETGRMYTDLSDSVMAFEAMRLTQGAEDTRPSGEKRVDINWQAATQFLGRVQNKEGAGPDNAGGFVYRPDESKAGATTNAAGAVVLRAYGSMTYAGLLSLIFAEVSKDDPRPQAAFRWATEHWSLDENPGLGPEGLYYFYNVMSKSLTLFGRDELPVRGRAEPVRWRDEVVRKLVALQQPDKDDASRGFWANKNNRWMESDPILVTSYTVIALETILGPASRP